MAIETMMTSSKKDNDIQSRVRERSAGDVQRDQSYYIDASSTIVVTEWEIVRNA